MKATLILLVFACCLASSANAKTKSVRIYFVPWEVESVADISQSQVRKSAPIAIEISDSSYAELFVKTLDEAKMTHNPSCKVSDIRLVVDALQDDGTTVVFYASRFAICSERSGNVRLIDDSFRSRFNFFGFNK